MDIGAFWPVLNKSWWALGVSRIMHGLEGPSISQVDEFAYMDRSRDLQLFLLLLLVRNPLSENETLARLQIKQVRVSVDGVRQHRFWDPRTDSLSFQVMLLDGPSQARLLSLYLFI